MAALRRTDLNRRITFQRPIADEAWDGAGSGTWQDVTSVWAQVQDVLPSRGERVADGIVLSNRPARIRMDFRRDITSDMRILCGERVLQIVAGPVEMGFREGLEMMAEEYHPAGNPA